MKLYARTTAAHTFKNRYGTETYPAGTMIEIDEHEADSNPKFMYAEVAGCRDEIHPHWAYFNIAELELDI